MTDAAETADDVQRAVDEWWSQRSDPGSAFSTLTIPVEALPILKRIWSDPS